MVNLQVIEWSTEGIMPATLAIYWMCIPGNKSGSYTWETYFHLYYMYIYSLVFDYT